jgi:hypothetical protein
MASSQAITLALAMFAESFPTRELTTQTARVWATVFENTTDEDLARAALYICRNPEQRFFPTSGEVFAAIRATKPRRLAIMPPVAPGQYERRVKRLAAPGPLSDIVQRVTGDVGEESA